MKILVTGGAGFIGSTAVEGLVAHGHRVSVLDDLSSGRRENLADVDARFVEGDIRDGAAVERALGDAEGVLHLAAFVSVPASVDDPVGSAEVNVRGTAVVLDACRRAGVRRLVLASSAAVYGDAEIIPTPEDAPLRPTSPYGEQKCAGERLCREAAEGGGLDTVSLRFFNVHGARQRPDSDYAAVIPAFRERVARGEAPRIHGDGTQTRDFVWVGDVAEGLERALLAEGRFDGIALNLASGVATTIADLARMVLARAGATVEPEFGPPREGDILHSVARIDALREHLGWAPTTPLEESLGP